MCERPTIMRAPSNKKTAFAVTFSLSLEGVRDTAYLAGRGRLRPFRECQERCRRERCRLEK